MKTNAFLVHILSPLELAAMRRRFKPFKYKLDDLSVYISQHTCNQLRAIVTHKTELMTATVRLERESISIPYKLRETFYDPRVVLSLPPYLRNRLCRLECYHMLTIMQRGRDYFLKEQKFGKRSMQVLDELFAKHGAGRLFK